MYSKKYDNNIMIQGEKFNWTQGQVDKEDGLLYSKRKKQNWKSRNCKIVAREKEAKEKENETKICIT